MSNFDLMKNLSSFVKLALRLDFSYSIHITNVKNFEKCKNSQKKSHLFSFRVLKGALANNAIDLQ